MVAERAQKGLNLPSSSSSFNKLHNEDPYDVERNKTGYIRLSSADNQLSSDLIKAKFDSINWSKFNKNLLFGYPRCGGETSTQASAATFINRFCRQGMPPIAADELTIVPGITTALDLLSQILFDPGDFILSPAPYYYRFLNDFGERGLVHIQLVPALSEGSQRTELSVERFEAAYEETHEKMGKVRAVIIVNPQNPEGCYNTLAEIGPIVEWALKKNLFILLDEIYDLCIYDEEPGKPFRTAVHLFQTHEQKQKLIWLWGLSKNFSLPGLRAGVVYSPNETVRTAVGRFMMHHQPNCMTQFVMREFLDDYAWFQHTYHPENLRRLRQARDLVLGFLDRLDVPYLKPRAGFFVMADFSKFLDKQSIEAERRLCKQFVQKKVLLTAGETVKAPKPGWFRIVFSSVDATTLEEALRRIKEAIQMAGGGEKK